MDDAIARILDSSGQKMPTYLFRKANPDKQLDTDRILWVKRDPITNSDGSIRVPGVTRAIQSW